MLQDVKTASVRRESSKKFVLDFQIYLSQEFKIKNVNRRIIIQRNLCKKVKQVFWDGYKFRQFSS